MDKMAGTSPDWFSRLFPSLTLRSTLVLAFLFFGTVLGLVSLIVNYHYSRELALTAAREQFEELSLNISNEVEGIELDGASAIQMLELFPQLNSPAPGEEWHPMVLPMVRSLSEFQHLDSIFAAYPDGSQIMVSNLKSSPSIREQMGAAPEDRWVIIHIADNGSGRIREQSYLNDTLDVRTRYREATDYDALTRPWYQVASETVGIVKTPVYTFELQNVPGFNMSKKTDSGVVIGVNISLASYSAFIQGYNTYKDSEIFIFNNMGEVTAYEPGVSASQAVRVIPIQLTRDEQRFVDNSDVIKVTNELDWPPFDFAVGGAPQGYSIDYLKLLSEKTGLRFDFINGYSFGRLMELFREGEIDLVHSLVSSPEREELGTFTDSYYRAEIIAVTRSNSQAFRSMDDLQGLRVALPEGYALSQYLLEEFDVSDFVTVVNPLEGLEAVRNGEADVMFEFSSVTRYLMQYHFIDDLKISDALSDFQNGVNHQLLLMVHHNQPELVSILNKAIASLSAEELASLEASWLSFNQSKGVSALQLGALPSREFLTLAETGSELQELEIGGTDQLIWSEEIESVYGENSFLGIMIPTETVLAPYLEKVRISLFTSAILLLSLIPVGYQLAGTLSSPIKDLIGENKKVEARKYDQVRKVDSNVKEIRDLSSSMVFMAASIKEYENAQKELMDAFIRLLAEAIDEKSEYTGGHCLRVPHLAFMLATAALDSDDEKFSDIGLKTEEEWREFEVACWLHDCGKVTTPDHIVDKGSKLEAIYNRIHEVRMRFEVLWRDAEIACWKSIAGGADCETTRMEMQKKHDAIREDFAFVANCNVGGEFMEDAAVDRLKEIGKQTWQQHLDDRLGLSPEEVRKIKDLPSSEPVQQLLADRPEHLSPRRSVKERDSTFGFNMPAPENKQNLGEIYNLSLTRGTLTAEDRYIINEHIINTIKMLETLPLPPELKKVPEFAGGHHETLDGRGYPRKLTAENLSIPARIVAIADIFEALTASDRPYKSAKPVSAALEIMKKMRDNSHIDPDLFALFLRADIYKKYAEEFLEPEQIDEVDVESYLT